MGSFGESAQIAGLMGTVGRGGLGFAGMRNPALEAWARMNDQRLIEQARTHGVPGADEMRWTPDMADSSEGSPLWTPQRVDAADMSGAAVMAQIAETDALIASMLDLL